MITLTIDHSEGREIHELRDGLYSIGRSEDCALQIPVNTVSRQHGEIRVEDARVFIRDTESMAGTEMEGQDVGASFIEWKAGSRVHMGEATLELGDRQSADSSDPEFGSQVISKPIYQLGSGLSRRARGRISRMLSRLLEIMSLSGTTKEVGRSACRMVAGMIRADQVYIETRSGPGQQLTALAGWPRMPSSPDDTPRGHHIRDLVTEERRSLLIPTLAADGRFDDLESCHGLTSAMAVPLFDGRWVLGVLYADSSDSGLHYGEDDLHVLTAVAYAVALRLRDILVHNELRTAKAIQRAMLPRALPAIPGYELDAHLETCEEVGGDLYQVMQRPDGDWLLALGDICGKGMPGALAMGASTVLLRSLTALGLPMETLIKHLHEQLYASFAEEHFLTLFLGQLEPASGTLEYAGAGHEAFVVQTDGVVRKLESTGMPVAVIGELLCGFAKTVLEPGELLAVCSDGVDEATADGEIQFAQERYLQLLVDGRRLPLPELRESIFDAVSDFVGPDGASDDITLLLVRRVVS